MSTAQVTQVTEDTFRLSANVSDILFEGMWPIPNGVAMNSYVVKGEKVAIIDGVCEWDGVPETLFSQLDEMQVDVNDIEYVILNHLEPDHTGWLNAFNDIRGDFKVYASQKGCDLAREFYGIDGDRLQPVKHGDTIDLGNGHVLHFFEIPNVHWPETIATYDEKTKTLFPCDAFGSFGAVTESPYDDTVTEKEMAFFEREANRYYANIVAAFSNFVERAIKKLADVDIGIIAPAHGLVWRKDPGKIIHDYLRYASYMKGPAEPEVTVLYGTMYGMSAMGVKPVVEGLKSEGIKVHVHQVPETNIGFILDSIWRSSGVVLGMPTYEYKMFPPMAAVLDELTRKKVLNRKAFRFGSYGWSGGAQKELDEIMERSKAKWDFLEPVEFRGRPSDEELDLIRQRGKELGQAVKAWVAEKESA